MRLQKYITEQKSFKESVPQIKKDCKKYIKEIRGAEGALFRFGVFFNRQSIIKKKTHSNRMPFTTPIEIHSGIDEMFLKKFKWKARSENVSFCWGMPFTNTIKTKNYPILFPIGKYRYLWSPKVEDLYDTLGKPKQMDVISDDDLKYYLDIFRNNFLNTYTNKNLKQAVKSLKEIMVGCKEYYLIKSELIEEVNEEFNLRWHGF